MRDHKGNSGTIIRFKRKKTKKQSELKNHLSNVLATITDRKIGAKGTAPTDIPANYYNAETKTVQDYYNFGLVMDGRKLNELDTFYRYGFNGKEEDPSFSSLTNYDYGFRIYNPSIGRFLSVDPLTKSYPYLTPYQFASNTPIQAIDLDGLEAKITIYGGSSDQAAFQLRAAKDIKAGNSIGNPIFVQNGPELRSALINATQKEGSIGRTIVFSHATNRGIYF